MSYVPCPMSKKGEDLSKLRVASHKKALESIPPGKYIFTQESTKITKFQYTLIQT